MEIRMDRPVIIRSIQELPEAYLLKGTELGKENLPDQVLFVFKKKNKFKNLYRITPFIIEWKDNEPIVSLKKD